MAYIDPATVLSPRGRVGAVRVLFDKGPIEGSWSAAEVEFDNRKRLGIRWNGEGESGVGSPQSRGLATWFIVPEDIEADLREALEKAHREYSDSLAAGYRAMANDAERERQAAEWVEGLIGDSSEAW